MNKKRIPLIGIVTVILLIIGAWIAYNHWQWDVQTSQASIDYWLDKRLRFWTGQNSILIYCKNGGEMDGDFYLVLQFTNASFSNQTEQPYYQVNQTAIKIPFSLHKGESESKWVSFSVNESVKRFSLFLSLEKINQNPLKQNPRYPTHLEYEWNDQESVFELVE